MPDVKFPPDKFGENLTKSGPLETAVFIGDEFQMRTAILNSFTTTTALLQTRHKVWSA